MRANAADYWALLLSTDWFFDYWPWLGLSVAPSKKPVLRDECRAIVKEMLGNAKEFWHVDFADRRVARTKQTFITALTKAVGDEHATKIARQIEARTPSATDDQLALISLLTESLANSTPVEGLPVLDQRLRQIATDAWAGTDEEVDFRELCRRSTTTWDQYTRALTPDQPRMLGDYITERALSNKALPYWQAVRSKLTETDANALSRWYESAALALSGQKLQLK